MLCFIIINIFFLYINNVLHLYCSNFLYDFVLYFDGLFFMMKSANIDYSNNFISDRYIFINAINILSNKKY